jgi:hypothetical protein
MNTIIDRAHLEKWADLAEAKLLMPKLIARLIQATTPITTNIDLPSGSAINLGGYDGLITCTENTSYIPAGKTVLELSAEVKAKAKISRDQKKRSTNPLGINPKDTSLLHITPRYLSDKDRQKLIQEGEKTWKNVQVYGSIQLVQWLLQAPAVLHWFAGLVLHINEGSWRGPEEFWIEWEASLYGAIPPELVFAGREQEATLLRTFLTGEPGVKIVRAATKSEALAFIVAVAILSDDYFRELFMARTLIIDSEQTFRTFRDNSINPANLIVLFDDQSPIRSAVQKGHHILVTMGSDEDSSGNDAIDLPILNRDRQIETLEKMGLDREKAERFSREAGRSISILRKLLQASDNRVKWTKYTNKRELIPALLIGRWDENNQSDRDLVAKLAAMPYESYINLLTNWQNYEATPIIKIGSKWRLTSALDTWIDCASFVTKADLDQLRLISIDAFLYSTAKYVPDANVSLFFPEPYRNKYSGWVLEGILKTFILIACYGDKLRHTEHISGQSWVDEVVMRIFECADANQWCFLNYRLPLLAEASPTIFLHALNLAITSPEQYLRKTFVKKEQREIIHSSDAHYYGLIWALEGLAWLPSHLYQACWCLLQLSKYIDTSIARNYPIDSLQKIFCPFYSQTLCNAERRNETIINLDNDTPDLTFSLLISILPKEREITYHTNRLYLRLFKEDRLVKIDTSEIDTSYANAVDLLLKRDLFSDQQLCELVNTSVKLPFNLQRRVLNHLEEIIPVMRVTESEVNMTLRGIISQHRSYPEQDWALPSMTLEIYERILLKSQAKELTLRHKWLFDTIWLDFPDEKLERLSFQELEEEQSRRSRIERVNALNEIIITHGKESIFHFSFAVNNPEILGRTYEEVFHKKEDIFEITNKLDVHLLNPEFALGFFSNVFKKEGLEYFLNLFAALNVNGFSTKTLAQILTAITPTVNLWKLIDELDEDIRDNYWQNVKVLTLYYEPGEEDEGLGYLIQHKRYVCAIDVASSLKEKLSTQSLLSLLNGLMETGHEQLPKIRSHSLLQIIKQIRKTHNVDRSEKIRLEWIYYPLLGGRTRCIEPGLLLFEELHNNPDFFINLLELAYPTETEALNRREKRQLITIQELEMARQATLVLNDWKTIPGSDPEGNIDFSALKIWIDTTRELAENKERLKYADMFIGQIFSRFPENDLNWPLLDLFKILESYKNKKMLESFNIGLFNKRGMSVRMPFSGGAIERNYAAYFNKLWKEHSIHCPNVAGEFLNLSNSFLTIAKREDDDAALQELDA